MSIPNAFRPVCGGTREVDFVQPIMISNDTWDTALPASCGMVLTGAQAQLQNAKWMAFDGNTGTSWATFSGGGTMTIEFEQPVKITMLRISANWRSTPYSCILSSSGHELGRHNGLEKVFDIISDRPDYSKLYELAVIPDVSGRGWTNINEIKISGFIKT